MILGGFSLGTLAAGGSFWTPAQMDLTWWGRDYEAIPATTYNYLGKPSLGRSGTAIMTGNVAPAAGPNGHNLANFNGAMGSGPSYPSSFGKPFFNSEVTATGWNGYNYGYSTAYAGGGWVLLEPGAGGQIGITSMYTTSNIQNWPGYSIQYGLTLYLYSNSVYMYVYSGTGDYGYTNGGVPVPIQLSGSCSVSVTPSPYYLVQFRWNQTLPELRVNGSAWVVGTTAGSGAYSGAGATYTGSFANMDLNITRSGGTPKIVDMATAYTISNDDADRVFTFMNRYYQVGL